MMMRSLAAIAALCVAVAPPPAAAVISGSPTTASIDPTTTDSPSPEQQPQQQIDPSLLIRNTTMIGTAGDILIAGIPPAFDSTRLPAMLSTLDLYQSQWVPIIVEGGNVTDTGVVQLLFYPTIVPGVRSVVTRQWMPGEAICASIEFPSATYSGVAMCFFGLSLSADGSRNISITSNDHTDDEVDIEFRGDAGYFQTNFMRGRDHNEMYYTYQNKTSYEICMYLEAAKPAAAAAAGGAAGDTTVATSDESQTVYWFVDGTMIQSSAFTSRPLYAHFNIWNTFPVWADCCGPIDKSNVFQMNILNFSMFSPDADVTTVPKNATIVPLTTTTTTTTASTAAPSSAGVVATSFSATTASLVTKGTSDAARVLADTFIPFLFLIFVYIF